MSFWNNIQHFSRSETTKNSAKLISANVVAQVIGLLIYPVITRLYAPEDFGLVNLFLSIGGIIVLLATAEYQYAIVLPKHDRDAAALLHVGGLITLAVTAAVALTIPARHGIASLFNTPELADWYFLLPLFVASAAAWNLLNYWLARKKQFSNISIYQLSQSGVNAGTKYAFGALGFLRGGLIVSSVIGSVAALAASVAMAVRNGVLRLAPVDKERCKRMAREYANFPKFSLPRALVNFVFGQIPVLLLTPVFGTAHVGFWSMSITLAFSPISMVSRSVYQVLYQKMNSEVLSERPLSGFYKKIITYTLLVAICGSCLLFPILPTLTQWLLGDIWHTTGEYIRYMLPWLSLSLVVASTSFIPDIFFKQRAGLLFEILLAVARLCGVVAGIVADNITISIAGYSFGTAIVVFLQLCWYWRLIKNYDQSINGKVS